MKKGILTALAVGLAMAASAAGPFSWKTKTWTEVESSDMMGTPYRTTMKYTVAKSYPDGSVLVDEVNVKTESGPDFDHLKPLATNPLAGKHAWGIFTPSGAFYSLQEGDPSFQAMPADVAMMKKASSA